MVPGKVIAAAASLLGFVSVAQAEQASPVAFYQPTIDITKDPGCGTKKKSREERIAFNKRLAELYFINFQQDRERGRNYSWWTWKCVAPDATILLGAVGPLAQPTKLSDSPERMKRDPNALTGEQRGYFATFPDWRTQPKTLVVVPFEEGAYFRMMYGGHGKDDGKWYSIWETNLILVNDEGLITHFEMWNDTIGMDATTRKAFGTGIKDLGTGGYVKATEGYPKDGKQTDKK